MAVKIARARYPSYTPNGTHFRKSIQDPGSNVRKLIDILDTDRVITRYDFYMETRVHPHGDFSGFDISGGVLHLRDGWNSSFWSAATRAGIIRNSGKRDDKGYVEYVPGERFDEWRMIADFFSKNYVETRWHYDEDNIPEGWNVWEFRG